MPQDIIEFYRKRDDYGFFSNFAPYPVTINGKTWPTTEHYFQAQKFAGLPHEETIRQAASAKEAATMGRCFSPIRKDWEQVKDDVMRTALKAKFGQHPKLKRLLLETGTAHLVEHTQNDCYWGDGGNGSGQNMLGQLLMERREQLARPKPIFCNF